MDPSIQSLDLNSRGLRAGGQRGEEGGGPGEGMGDRLGGDTDILGVRTDRYSKYIYI